MSVLSDVKTLVEMDTDTTYDTELLMHINSGMQYLANCGVPVGGAVDASTEWDSYTDLAQGDSRVVLDWLHHYVLSNIDPGVMSNNNTKDWIEQRSTTSLWHLKAIYDRTGAKAQ
jgi:hypothetical protein